MNRGILYYLDSHIRFLDQYHVNQNIEHSISNFFPKQDHEHRQVKTVAFHYLVWSPHYVPWAV